MSEEQRRESELSAWQMRQANSTQANDRSHPKQPVSVDDTSHYCNVCYSHFAEVNRSAGGTLRSDKVKQLCNSTKMGCPGCDQRICKQCWVGYSHHTGKTTRDFDTTAKSVTQKNKGSTTPPKAAKKSKRSPPQTTAGKRPRSAGSQKSKKKQVGEDDW